MSVQILDCTLRDGGYVNDFKFTNSQTQHIISFLNDSNIDIVECGFLDAYTGQEKDSTRFNDIEIINSILTETKTTDTLHVAMLEYGKYDVDSLPLCNLDSTSNITGIRFSFRKSDHNAIFNDMKTIIDKGYKLFIQPIATETYNDVELIDFMQKCNQYNPYAFYIVDTHGSMHRDNLRRLYYLLDHNLANSIKIGFHSHNNLQLSYSNAIDLIEINKFTSRNIIIDASVFGMGRGAGNLNTELLSGYLNTYLNSDYNVDNLLEIMDKYLLSIRQKNAWGYSLEHYLSAVSNCHPNYASFLINQKNLDIIEIKQLLDLIPQHERREYNKKIINDIYIHHKENINLKIKAPNFDLSKKVILIGSGPSVKEYQINKKMQQQLDESIKISLNHPNKYIKYNYVLFSNQARYNEFCDELDGQKIIVTSNIKVRSKHFDSYVLDYKALFEYNDIKIDNVTLLTLNYLKSISINEVSLMGVDGYNEDNSYSYHEDNRIVDTSSIHDLNGMLIQAYKTISQTLHLQFITPSIFKKHIKQKIVGVIPARYASTRLPGKPLLDICGLPMIIHVLKRAQLSTALDEVIVATDDSRIYDEVLKHGGKAILTDVSHNNGSERLVEISHSVLADVYVLINGDEALLNPKHIKDGVDSVLSSHDGVSLLFNDFSKKQSPSDFKVVINKYDEIMYISRNDIPSDARNEVTNMYKAYHIMSFTKEFLNIYEDLSQTPLDFIESHELLRVLENAYRIQGKKVDSTAISVDTPADLEYVIEKMKDDKIYKEYKDIND